MKVKTQFSEYDNVKLQVDNYVADNSLFIEIFNEEEGPIADITRCLGDNTLSQDEAYVDTNNCPWAPAFIEENDLGYFTGKINRSGFCVYPVFHFDLEKIKEYI